MSSRFTIESYFQEVADWHVFDANARVGVQEFLVN